MQENRKEAEIYIRKLHEMLPELKEKYHVSYLEFLGLISGESRSREATWTYSLNFPEPLLFLNLSTLKTTFRMPWVLR